MKKICSEKICSIVQDVMPLCVEDIAANDTKAFVQEHIAECSDCKKEWDILNSKDELVDISAIEAVPLKSMRKKMLLRIAKAAALAVLVLITILTALGYHAKDTHCKSYAESGIQLDVSGSTIKYSSKNGSPLTLASYSPKDDASEMVYTISSEYSYANLIFNSEVSEHYEPITIGENQSVTVYFYNYETNESKLLYNNTDRILPNVASEDYTEASGVALPNALQYYLIFVLPAVALILICALLIKLPFKNKPQLCSNTTYLMLVPIAYLIALAMTEGITPKDPSWISIANDSIVIVLTVLIFFIEVLIRRIIIVHHPNLFKNIIKKIKN